MTIAPGAFIPPSLPHLTPNAGEPFGSSTTKPLIRGGSDPHAKTVVGVSAVDGGVSIKANTERMFTLTEFVTFLFNASRELSFQAIINPNKYIGAATAAKALDSLAASIDHPTGNPLDLAGMLESVDIIIHRLEGREK